MFGGGREETKSFFLIGNASKKIEETPQLNKILNLFLKKGNGSKKKRGNTSTK